MQKQAVLIVALVLCAGTAFAQSVPQWEFVASMSTPRSGLAVVAVGDAVYAVGGRDDKGRPSDALERFDVHTGEWEILPSMPTARYDAAAAFYQGRLVVLGGRGAQAGSPGNNRVVLDVVEAYDPGLNSWVDLPPLVEAREGHAAFVLNDTLFALGGSNENQSILDAGEFYTGDDGAGWQSSPGLHLDVPRVAFAMVVSRGRAFAIGGFTPLPVNYVQEFRHSGSRVPPGLGEFVPRGALAVAAIGDSVFVMGGRGPGAGTPGQGHPVLHDVDLYLPSMSTWQPLTPMLEGRESFGAAAVGNRVIIAGGRDGNREALGSVEMMILPEATAADRPVEQRGFFLDQNAPNPFSGQTEISFGVGSSASHATLEIFDVSGRRVRLLLSGALLPGAHRVTWDGRADDGARLASGVYLYRLTHGSHYAHRKLVLVQ